MVERRQHERVALRAEAQLARNGFRQRLLSFDVSIGGAYLETTLSDHIELKPGGHFELTIVCDEDTPLHAAEEGSTVHAHARIVRRDPGGDGRPSGVAVAFEHVDLDNLTRLQAVVGRGG